MTERAILQAALTALDRGDLRRVRELLEHAVASAATPSTWSVGSVVHDRWEIFGEARGGMGTVHFVVDRAWDMRLAVKTLTLSGDLPAERALSLARMFQRETQLWLDLGAHPHIVSAYYTLELDGALRLFMEFVPGRTLADLVKSGRTPLVRVLDLALQLVAGMEYVHARGVVHRDLKPGNCLVVSDDTLRITDFGLGKREVLGARDARDAVGETALAETGAAPAGQSMSMFAAGTPLYMAPEQWLALADAGKAADVYAFGAMLYELLVGTPPFGTDPATWELDGARAPAWARTATSGPAVAAALRILHEHATPRAPGALGAPTTPELDALAIACLAKDAAARPTFAAVRERLLAIYRTSFGAAYPRALPGGLDPDEGGENNRAASYYAMGDTTRARQILEDWLRDHPQSLHPWINRQVIALNAGEIDAATVAGELRERLLAAPEATTLDRQIAAFQRRLRPLMLVHPDGVGALAVGRGLVATGGADSTVRVFRDDAIERMLPCGSSVVALGGVDQGRLIAAVLDGRILEWSATDDQPRVLAVRPGTTALAVLRGGEVVAVGKDIVAIAPDGTTREMFATSRGRCVAVHPDGARFVIGSDDGRFAVWRLDGTREVVPLQCSSSIVAVAWGPGGERLVVGDTEDATIVPAARPEATGAVVLRGTDLRAVAISPDGRLAVTTDGAAIRVWDAADGHPVRTIAGHRAIVHALAFDDAGQLVSASSDGTVRRWELPSPSATIPALPLLVRRSTGTQERLARRRERDTLLPRLAAGDTTAVGELDRLCDAAPEYRRDPEIVRALVPLAARGIAVEARDAWCAWQIPLDEVRAVGEHGDELLVVDGAGALVRLAADGGVLARFAGAGDVRRAAIAPGGAVAVSCRAERTWLRSTVDGRAIAELHGHAGWVDGVAISDDDRFVLTASDDHTARVWDAATGQPAGPPLPHPDRVWSCVSTDGEHVITGCRDGIVRIWSRASARVLHELRPDGESTGTRAHLAATGHVFASVIRTPSGATTSLVALRGSEPVRIGALPAHAYAPAVATFSRDGRLLVTGGNEATRIWSAATGRLVRHLGTAIDARAAAFVAGGSAVLVGHGGTVVLWRLDLALAFAADAVAHGRALLAGADPATTPWPLARACGFGHVADELARVAGDTATDLVAALRAASAR